MIGTAGQSQLGNGLVQVDLRLALAGRALNAFDIRIDGQPLAGGGVEMTSSTVTLGTSATPAIYSGHVTALAGTSIQARVSSRRGSLALLARLQIDASSGSVTGNLTAEPVARRAPRGHRGMRVGVELLLSRLLLSIGERLMTPEVKALSTARRRVELSHRERSRAPTGAGRTRPTRRQPLPSTCAAARPQERLSPRLATVLLSASTVLALAGCGARATSAVVTRSTRSAPSPVAAGAPTTPSTTRVSRPDPVPPPPSHPRLLTAALGSSPTAFVPVVSWRGRTAVWIARSPSGVALLAFDQHLVELRLHSGTVDAGGSGWRFGPAVLGMELGRLVAAFNGGFKFSTGRAALSLTDASPYRWATGSARSSHTRTGAPTSARGTRACQGRGRPWRLCART